MQSQIHLYSTVNESSCKYVVLGVEVGGPNMGVVGTEVEGWLNDYLLLHLLVIIAILLSNQYLSILKNRENKGKNNLALLLNLKRGCLVHFSSNFFGELAISQLFGVEVGSPYGSCR